MRRQNTALASREEIQRKRVLNREIRRRLAEEKRNRTNERKAEQKLLRRFTYMLKRAGFKDAGGTGAGIDIALEVKKGNQTIIITADQHKTFGNKHQENRIEIRIKNKQLHNQAQWIITINRQGEITAFQTSALAAFIKYQAGSVRFVERRKKYDVCTVSLADLFSFMKRIQNEEPIRAGGISAEAAQYVARQITKKTLKSLAPKETPRKNFFPPAKPREKMRQQPPPRNALPQRNRPPQYPRKINPGKR